MEYKDYYKALGVDKSASANEIRSAFKKLAMKFHPDRNQGDKQAEEKFKEVNEAYQVLSDPEKKKRYDQLGSAYFDYQRGGGQPGGFDWSQWSSQGGQPVDIGDIFGGQGGFSDFFSAFFGGMGGMNTAGNMRGQSSFQRRPNYEQSITVSLTEAFQGSARILETTSKKIEVKIPAGTKTGTKIRVPGASPDGTDLILKISVADDPRFTRDGDDLFTTAEVDVFTAILGGDAEVETMTGKVKLTIPAGTQADQKFRIQKRGMPHLKDPSIKGDLFIQLKINIPKNLSPQQKDLIRQARDQ